MTEKGIISFENNHGGPAQVRSDLSTSEKIGQIEKEIHDISRTVKDPAEQKLIEEKRSQEYETKKRELEEKLGPMSDGSDEAIRKNLVDDVLEEALKDNARLDRLRLEKQELSNLLSAEDLVNSLEDFGVHPPQEERGKLIELLTSPKLVDCDRGELVKLLGIDLSNKELVDRLSVNKELDKKFQRVLRGQLVSTEYRELLLAMEMEYAGKEDYEKSGAGEIVNYSGEEINDPEIAGKRMQDVKQLVRDILTDEDSTAGQGVFWNVVVSKKVPYVLKAEIKLEDEKKARYQRRSLLYYPVIRDTIGKEFLPRQVILKSEKEDRYFVLQERQELDKMIKIKKSTMDNILKGDYGPEIIQSLKIDKNRTALRKFIEGVDKLSQQHRLMIDILGDNLFFSVKDDKLEIKLVDYGCFETKWAKRHGDVADCEELILKLKQLCG
jgi:hypothetical protein